MIETSIYELSQIKGLGRKTLNLIKQHFAKKNTIKLPRKTKRGDIEVNRIYNEDCLDTMYRMSDEFVDLTITSPPYDNSRSYETGIGETWNFDIFKQIAGELYRVTKTGGVVVWVVGDATIYGSETGTSFRQALHFMNIGFDLYDTMIYAKNNPIPKNHLRYEQAFEYMFVFSKGKPKTINLLREPCKFAGKKQTGTMRNGGGDELKPKHGIGKVYKNDKPKSNIWYYSVGNGLTTSDTIAFGHPAIYPEQLVQDHIISWSNPNDLIYDPFMGSGTTAKMAKLNGRNYVGSEVSAEYCKIIEERLK